MSKICTIILSRHTVVNDKYNVVFNIEACEQIDGQPNISVPNVFLILEDVFLGASELIMLLVNPENKVRLQKTSKGTVENTCC